MTEKNRAGKGHPDDAALVSYTHLEIEQMKTDLAKDGQGQSVVSPLVGVFYAAPSEEAAPFVQVGDRVKKGQTLGIVEAMKLMNNIESEYDEMCIRDSARTVLIVAVGLTLNIQLSADIFLRIAGFLSQLADLINKKGIFHTVPPCQIVIIADFGLWRVSRTIACLD